MGLLGLATPYRVVEAGDPVMRATLAQIEADLECGGGLHRYATDTYYGGGEWVLLTAWLAWHYAELGETAKARAALDIANPLLWSHAEYLIAAAQGVS